MEKKVDCSVDQIFLLRPPLKAFMLQHVPQKDMLQLNNREIRRVRSVLLSCLLQHDSYSVFQHRLKHCAPVIPKPFTKLRKLMIEHPILNSSYKLACIESLQGDRHAFEDYDLPLAYDELAKVKRYLPVTKLRNNINRSIKIRGFSYEHQQELLARNLNDLEKMLYKTAQRLRFIAKSNRFDLDDLVKELQEKVIQTFRWLYPFQTPEHLYNSCIQAMRNHSINRINYYTAKKRARLHRDGDNFYNTFVLLNADTLNKAIDYLEIPGDDSLFYRQVMDKVSPIEKAFLRVMTLEEDQVPFLKWANSRLEEDFNDLEEIHSFLGQDGYERLAARYFNLKSSDIDNLYSRFKS